MPANSKATIDLLAAVNRLRNTYIANAATIATLAGLAAGATDPEIQALNTAMPAATADLSTALANFLAQQQVH